MNESEFVEAKLTPKSSNCIRMKKQLTYIHQLKNHISSEVDLAGWVYNVRSSGSLVFIECRDGSGLCQCVVNKEEVPEESWEAAMSLKQNHQYDCMA